MLILKTVIDSGSSGRLSLSEIIRFKGLLWNLSMRDVLVRYKQTLIGVLWAVVRPAINIAIFVFFSMFIEGGSDLQERIVNVGAGIIIWGLISTSITDVSNSLLNNSNILTKVYFPKLIIPISTLAVCLIDFLISFFILLICKIAINGFPGPEFFLFPVFVLYAILFSFSVGLFFATLNVKYRDIKFTLPFLLQIGFYACPVFLSASFYLEKLPASFAPIFMSNPLVTVIEGFKYCFLGQSFGVDMVYVLSGLCLTFLVLIFSLRYFVKFEKTFADFI